MKNCFFILVIMAMAGCGPVYKKFYDYEPMRTESQRTCAMTCQLVKQSCFSNQQQAHQLCQSNARFDYQSCKNNERWGYNRKGKWECIDNCYCFESSCSEPNRDECEDEYASCFRGCGGRVSETTRCVANCERQ